MSGQMLQSNLSFFSLLAVLFYCGFTYSQILLSNKHLRKEKEIILYCFKALSDLTRQAMCHLGNVQVSTEASFMGRKWLQAGTVQQPVICNGLLFDYQLHIPRVAESSLYLTATELKQAPRSNALPVFQMYFPIKTEISCTRIRVLNTHAFFLSLHAIRPDQGLPCLQNSRLSSQSLSPQKGPSAKASRSFFKVFQEEVTVKGFPLRPPWCATGNMMTKID